MPPIREGWHRPGRPTPPSFWDGPWPWIIAGAAVVVGGAILIGVATQPAPPPTFVITLH